MADHLHVGWPQTSATHVVITDYAAFVRGNTSVLSPPLVPEVKLHLAHEALPIWQKTEEQLGEIGLPPPFWAFAWAGGQALSRYILDHPETVRGLRVIDIASGSGLVGIAAMKAGAQSLLAADIDLFSVAAIAANAALNNVQLVITSDDLLVQPPPQADVILVGDLFYEKSVAEKCLAWLEQAKAQNIEIFIGDPGRSYLPKTFLHKIAEYEVPVSRDLEDAEIKRTAVWQLLENY
jgi:predicted nicotinamide N-methyase